MWQQLEGGEMSLSPVDETHILSLSQATHPLSPLHPTFFPINFNWLASFIHAPCNGCASVRTGALR